MWLVALGLIAAAAVVLAVFRFGASEPPPRAQQPRPAALAQAREPIAPAPARPAPAAPQDAPSVASEEPAPPLTEAETPPESEPAALPEPPMREDPIVGYGPPGTGIQAFPPPGTSPPLSGLIVPEDFELPEGYVRHHQVTDDGQDLPPILMFHPDYKEWEGPDGKPVAIPADRVVPPELAPPGMPIEPLEIPAQGSSDAP